MKHTTEASFTEEDIDISSMAKAARLMVEDIEMDCLMIIFIRMLGELRNGHQQ